MQNTSDNEAHCSQEKIADRKKKTQTNPLYKYKQMKKK